MRSKYNIEDEEWESLASSLYDCDSELTDEERRIAINKLNTNQKEADELFLITKNVDLYFELKKYPAEDSWEKIQEKIQRNSKIKTARIRRFFSTRLMRIAATVFFAVLLTLAGYEVIYNKSASSPLLEISSTDQILKTFTLPDGTLVSLNSNSHLKYPKRFGKNSREVLIEGEAFFEVKPNKRKPFIIHAGSAQIKVLGTSFNVNAYPSAELLEVIVETGTVRVLNKSTETKQNNELILDPGEKGTLVYSSHELLKTTNQNPNFMAWKTHDLIFRSTSLGEVISNLEKVYKVNIRLADPNLNGLLLTAHFNDYSLDFILKVIESTFRIEVQKVDGLYILKAKS